MKNSYKFMIAGGVIGTLAAIVFELGEILAQCFWNRFEVLHIIIVGIMAMGAIPISKRQPRESGRVFRLFVAAGTSEFTNLISLLGQYLRIRFGKEPRLPRRVLGTPRVFGVLGRVNVIAFLAFVTYDITAIGICVIRII